MFTMTAMQCDTPSRLRSGKLVGAAVLTPGA